MSFNASIVATYDDSNEDLMDDNIDNSLNYNIIFDNKNIYTIDYQVYNVNIVKEWE